MRRPISLSLLILGFLAVTLPLAHAREGFGFKKKAVDLDRRIPPEVLLVGTTIDVRIADHGGFEPEARRVRELVQEKMLAYDTRLSADAGKPQITIDLDLDESSVDQTWSQKTEYESRQTGTKIETDSKGNKKEKPVYSSVPVTVNYKDVAGTVAVSYLVTDAMTKSEIYRGDARATFSSSYKKGDGAPMPSELEGRLIEQAASKVSGALVGRTEPVSVLLPRASFEKLIPLAERGDWESYRSQVEAMPAKKKPADEAFRQYALGVATEALAYRAANETTAIDLLTRSAEHYRQAVAMNPREELFAKAYSNFWTGSAAASPLRRVEEGLANYQKLDAFRAQLASAAPSSAPRSAAAPPAKPASATPASSKTKAAKALRNDSIIEMAKAGLNDQNIILAIDGAPGTEFDLSPDGLVTMAKSGVSPNVIAHMQKKK